jgi:anti-sigma-K factor RskA
VAAAVVAVLGIGAAVWQPWAGEQPAMTAADRVLAADDAQRVSVDLDDGVRATLVRSVSERRAVLLTEGMPPPPDGKVYEVWLQSPEDDMVPAGLMPADDDQMVLEGDAAEATAAGITVEPAGGSESPTSDPIVLFDFAEAT